ncbi:MAG: hypothetical protein LBD41_02320, partial [Clostridiales Family XIII bacterium]|nr:hypothetical protein [Clostridiales Family XIII bacterium]
KQEAYYGLCTGAVLMRKELFEKIVFFDETMNLNTGEIIAMTIKMNECGLKQKKLDLIACNRRLHNTNYGRTNRTKEFKDYASILKAHLIKKAV